MNKPIRHFVTTSAVLLALATAAGVNAAVPTTLEPGEWKVTVQTDLPGASIPGLPGLKLPAQAPMTYRWCYKPEPDKNLGQTLADTANHNVQGQKCTMLENVSSGNAVHYKMQCIGQQTGTTLVTGDFTISGKTYRGKTHLDMQSPVGPVQMASTVAGDYMGQCKGQPQTVAPANARPAK